MDAATINLLMATACILGLYISRIEQSRKAEAARALMAVFQPSLAVRRSHETEYRLNAFIDEAEEILGIVSHSRGGEDSGVDGTIADYHDRLILFLMKNMGAYFARRLHAHQGLRDFSRKAYPAALSYESIRACRHLETDIMRLTSFLSLIDRPLPNETMDEEDREAKAA
jgi:hypothetical protein